MTNEGLSKEERILKSVYSVLIDVVRDTTTDPRLKHPLSDRTKQGIRDCLDLVTARQAELAREAGRPAGQERPHYVDEPGRPVAVPIDLSTLRKKKAEETDSSGSED